MSCLGKIHYILGLCLLIGSLQGCSEKIAKQSEHKKRTKAAQIAVIFQSGDRKDQPYNLSVFNGSEESAKRLGATVTYIDNTDPNNYVSHLTELAKSHKDLIIVVGRGMKNPLERIASLYPSVKFAYIDGVVDLPNVRSITFREQEGCYLVGYLAGLITKTNKIGFVGGINSPQIRAFQISYEAGAKTANPKVVMLPKYVGSFEHADAAKQAASLLYDQGTDIVFQGAGNAGLGVFKAAKEKQKYAIGVDSDQDHLEPGTILISMVKSLQKVSYDVIQLISDGKFKGGKYECNLKDGGVGVSEMKYTKDLIGNENLKKIDKVKALIVAGRIHPPINTEQLCAYLKSINEVREELN